MHTDLALIAAASMSSSHGKELGQQMCNNAGDVKSWAICLLQSQKQQPSRCGQQPKVNLSGTLLLL